MTHCIRHCSRRCHKDISFWILAPCSCQTDSNVFCTWGLVHFDSAFGPPLLPVIDVYAEEVCVDAVGAVGQFEQVGQVRAKLPVGHRVGLGTGQRFNSIKNIDLISCSGGKF